MSWRRQSLFTKRTRAPGATVSSFGEATPPDAMVMTLGLVGGGEGAGVPPPPPHAASPKTEPRQHRA